MAQESLDRNVAALRARLPENRWQRQELPVRSGATTSCAQEFYNMTTSHLLRETDAAKYLGLAPKTLARWRWAGKGPAFHKLGSAVRYSVQELDLFISGSAVAR